MQQFSKRALTILWVFPIASLYYSFKNNFPVAQRAMAVPQGFKCNRTIKRRHLGKSAAAELKTK